MEEEICLLDPRVAPRGKGNRQRSLGRPTRPPGSRQMESAATASPYKESLEKDKHAFFYHSTPGSYSHIWEQFAIYNRFESSSILGQSFHIPQENDDTALQQDSARCFNCGDPDHKVSACPLPANRELISLSRQYYHFFNGSSGPWQRVHTFESHRQQRLDWLEEFQPGEIRGDLLKSALVGNTEEWLRNICTWGYPPGWISDVDPRELVRAKIWSEYDFDNDSLETFEIHGEDEVEAIVIGHNDAEDDPGLDDCAGNASSNNQNEVLLSPITRWAAYPNRYFSTDLLCPHIPTVPSLFPPSWDDTSFVDTTAYLRQHLLSSTPPPPSISPPPLPPDSPIAGVPSLPSSKPYHSHPLSTSIGSESDMELSDSE